MAANDTSRVFLSSSPHYSVAYTSRQVMFAVVAALLPVAAWGVWLFGVPALVTIVVSTASCVAFESLFRLVTRKDVRAGDFSAAITGLLLAMVLPPSTPVWMTVLGALFAIVVAKEFFGGLGANVFNPALSGRAFLLVSFAVPLTTWSRPLVGAFSSDAVTGATPLTFIKPGENAVSTAAQIAEKIGLSSPADLYWTLLLGQRSGSIGESAIIIILLMFVVLLVAKVIDWRAPVAMVVTAIAITTLAGLDPIVSLLSGGLLFGAVFMTTDYATSPVTPGGRLLFGFGCGLITALIRIFGGYPEGVMFSILIMNAIVPFLNKIIVRKYGWVAPAKKEKASK